MKVIIGGTTEYDTLKNLRFAPSAHVVNERVAIDEFECDVMTDDNIEVGVTATLADGDDSTWMFGFVTYSEEEDVSTRHIIVQSELLYLDKRNMNAKMYSNDSLSDVLRAICYNTSCTILADSDLVSGVTISGYCPKQTKRERLQQVLFATGMYIRSSFVEHPTLMRFEENESVTIPNEKIYWKPVPSYLDYYTSVTVTSFSYRQGTPSDDDEYVKVGGKKYIITRTDITLTNPDVPETAPKKELVIDDIGIINGNNASEVLSMLALYYFKRTQVDLDVINNREYFAGERYTIQINPDDDYMVTGYAEELDFRFGHQAKSQMKLGACVTVPCHKLRIKYISKEPEYGTDIIIAKRTFTLPEGYPYKVTNPYVNASKKHMSYVFRPSSDYYEGIMHESDQTGTVHCYFALKRNGNTGILDVISVDSVERKSSSGEYYAEIQ